MQPNCPGSALKVHYSVLYEDESLLLVFTSHIKKSRKLGISEHVVTSSRGFNKLVFSVYFNELI